MNVKKLSECMKRGYDCSKNAEVLEQYIASTTSDIRKAERICTLFNALQKVFNAWNIIKPPEVVSPPVVTTPPIITSPSKSEDRYDSLFQYWAKLYNMDWRITKAQAIVESTLRCRIVSPAGAIGLLQIMPLTGKDMGVEDPDDLFDPDINIKTSMKYYNWLHSKYGEIEEPTERVKFTLAAYNAGRGNVNQAEKIEKVGDGKWQIWDEVSDELVHITGEDNANQTINYVKKVMSYLTA